MAFYLKYRPQTIEEIDNQRIREILPSLFSSKEIPHAYLFIGPKGIGKTSTARIIAKLVNCPKRKKEKNSKVEPCNSCDICRAVTNGSHLDVLEMDAASNRGIEEIRELKTRIGLAPAELKYKVYIIDEVHMLTSEAFNALLKTLEEPPLHALFILCTTESGKVPETIKSRCVILNFSLATDGEMGRSIDRIVQGEKLKLEETAKKLIIKRAGGSFREAAKILEELSLVQGGAISLTGVKKALNLGGVNAGEITSYIMLGDAAKAVGAIEEAVSHGADASFIYTEIFSIMHKKFLVAVTDTVQNSKEIASLRKAIDIIGMANEKMRYSPIPQLPLETAIVEYCLQENK